MKKPEQSEQSLLAPLEGPHQNGGSRIKVPKSSEHDLTNLVKKYHQQDPRARKWLRIDARGKADVIEVKRQPPLPTHPTTPRLIPVPAQAALPCCVAALPSIDTITQRACADG